MYTMLKKYALAAALIPSIALSSFALSAFAATEPSCSTVTLYSGTTTQTAGWSETNQGGAPGSLAAANYSGGTWSPASPVVTAPIPPWINPATDPDYSGSGAVWISSSSTGPGDEGNTEGNASSSQWRLFHDSFTLPAGATVNSAQVWYSTDNAGAVYLNSNATPISTTNTGPDEVYGDSPASPGLNFDHSFTTTFTPVAGANSLDFVVRNWNYDGATNPTGLLYKAVVNYCVPQSVKVTVSKFVNGEMATASSSQSLGFPVDAEWNAENIGNGIGEFILGPNGFNSPNPYQAITSDMSPGASYTAHERLDQDNVALDCTTNKPYRLVGYTTGATMEDAAGATPSMTVPAFTNMTGDQNIIIWNASCSPTSTTTGQIGGDVTGNNGVLTVTSITPVQTTATADGTYEHGWKYIFHITVPTNEPKLAMKFADWFNASASTTLPVANNMRISSAQASSTATITLTAANTYSSPDMMITGDLDAGTAGRQVDVLVEVSIPNSTVNGSYTTSYGVRSLP